MTLPSKAHVFTMDFSPKPPLEAAVMALNSKAKKAFYGAARRLNVISRGTWNGCAFNAGAAELGIEGIDTFAAAAKAMGVSHHTVTKFISAWDGTAYPGAIEYHATDKGATDYLVSLLEKAGLFSDHALVRVTVYDAQELAEIKELQAELDSGALLDGILELEAVLCGA